MHKTTEGWGTRVGLVLAMAGNAVGLGNFLRFPTQAVQNGGGGFIIPYIICLLLLGLPLLWIEWAAGRYGGRRGAHTTPFIMDALADGKAFWKYFGVFGIFINIAVAGYYCYIEAWTLAYIYHSLAQTFTGMEREAVAQFFLASVDTSQPAQFAPSLGLYLVCLLLNVYILSRGLSGGIEKAARWLMPMLIFFGAFLAVYILFFVEGRTGCADCGVTKGLNFLWEPNLQGIFDPKTWIAAAGQVCFTLAVAMGSVQCYASYLKPKDDLTLNALSTGWLNTFVEVVLGASIVIPISVAYLGLEWVQKNAGFAMGFQTIPYLFVQWGTVMGTIAGVMWFGLLFFAGITSSLAMGLPWMSFMEHEFNWQRNKAAYSFGLLTLIIGLPTVLLFNEGVFDEFDYWAGTIALLVFGVGETILFGWVLGIEKGWNEIMEGADLKLPGIYRYIIKYITPALLIFVFFAALFKPLNNDWKAAFQNGWQLDPSSLIGKLSHKDIVANRSYYSNQLEADVAGIILLDPIETKVIKIVEVERYYRIPNILKVTQEALPGSTAFDSIVTRKTYHLTNGTPVVLNGSRVQVGDTIAEESHFNPIFFSDLARFLMLALFGFIAYVVYLASQKRLKP